MDLVEDKAKIIAGKATSWNIPPGFEKCCPMDAITVENDKRG